MPDRYNENAAGDFYVEDGVCTSCGAPQAEAPDLIGHSKNEYSHCYFKKQPETEEEIERAISAIQVSCISGLRYGGSNEKILKRLYEIGEAAQCDQKPLGNYKPLIWNNVTFRYEGPIKELSELITPKIGLDLPASFQQEIILQLLSDDSFEIIYKWRSTGSGDIFKCHSMADSMFSMELSVEDGGNEISIRGTAIRLNTILITDKKISEICWFDQDNNAYSSTELK
ncbi:MAG: ferredoxin [Chitinophagaceae bacterium]|nr:ferredoxin [Chitinophagaceae bacterium]